MKKYNEPINSGFWRQSTTSAFVLPLAISACVFVPQETRYHDTDCNIEARRLELKPVILDNLDCGNGEGSEYCIVALLAVGAGSAVVSGTIVVVGNTVYWLDEKSRCAAKKI